jgi:hypothetical protein
MTATVITRRARLRKQRDLNAIRGISNRVEATEIRDHLNELHQSMTWAHIARISGSGRCRIVRIANGLVPQVNRITHQKIMAIQAHTAPVDGNLYVDATGTRRRLQALACVGWSQAVVADIYGASQWGINEIVTGASKTLRKSTADRFAGIYETLRHQTPEPSRSVTRVRNYAAHKGWHGPEFWEDMGGIDDPTFDPDAQVEPKRPAAEVLAENAHWLLTTGGLSVDQVAARLGKSRAYIEKALREHPQDEEAAA